MCKVLVALPVCVKERDLQGFSFQLPFRLTMNADGLTFLIIFFPSMEELKLVFISKRKFYKTLKYITKKIIHKVKLSTKYSFHGRL